MYVVLGQLITVMPAGVDLVHDQMIGVNSTLSLSVNHSTWNQAQHRSLSHSIASLLLKDRWPGIFWFDEVDPPS